MIPQDDAVGKKPSFWAWVRTALAGIGICGLIGPLLPVLVWMPVEVFHDRHTILDALKALVVSFYMWPFAVILMGPAGALFGALGALWIRYRSQNVNPKRLWIETALLDSYSASRFRYRCIYWHFQKVRIGILSQCSSRWELVLELLARCLCCLR